VHKVEERGKKGVAEKGGESGKGLGSIRPARVGKTREVPPVTSPKIEIKKKKQTKSLSAKVKGKSYSRRPSRERGTNKGGY